MNNYSYYDKKNAYNDRSKNPQGKPLIPQKKRMSSFLRGRKQLRLCGRKQNEGSIQGEKPVTTNQLRNILTLINNISIKSGFGGDTLSREVQNDIKYLLVKIYYACGRDKSVNSFVNTTKLIELLLCVGDSRDRWLIFSKYVESLVAFHKYLGGKD